MATVSELLDLSRSAHQRYRENVPRRVTDGSGTVAIPGDGAMARSALRDAQRARLAAHDLDPQHTDAAWKDEDLSAHASLIAFYEHHLA